MSRHAIAHVALPARARLRITWRGRRAPTRPDATLWCWGDNGSGRLGIGNTTQQTSPVQVGAGTTWSSVAPGAAHSCARQSDATVWCWGSNTSGQLGDGTYTARTTPVQVASVTAAAVYSGSQASATFVIA